MVSDYTWPQRLVEFTRTAETEQTAAREIAPALNTVSDVGVRRTWWFIRKSPAWRIRFRPEDADLSVVDDLLDGLRVGGHITNWTPSIYEPETLAFGGEDAMEAAHILFHHDSRYFLERELDGARQGLGQKGTTTLLFSAMLRAAGLDWYEQGDVWARIAVLRPAKLAHPVPPEQSAELDRAVRRLMTADSRSVPGVLSDEWLTAFESAGQALAALARKGRLGRGIRAVLAHHFIFHANRVGLTAADQASLAKLATEHIFHAPDRPNSSGASPVATRVRDMTTAVGDSSTSAQDLRNTLADKLRSAGNLRTSAVETALRAVPRHLFLPGVSMADAYADEPIYTKHDRSGARISAASQPAIVAMMLEQLQLEPGHRVLELGAGTGYNAALMASIVGPSGHVTTIDIDEDLVEDARKHLAAAAITGTDVVLADGALGHSDAAPYDRVIATVGAFETPTAWLEQLAPGGRLVVPLRLAGAASRSVIFERGENGWSSLGSEMNVFMPLRGIGDDSRRLIDLAGTGEIMLQTHKDNTSATDTTTLVGVLETPRHEFWTGVHFVPMESFEWLDLWLACRLPNPIMRMEVEPGTKSSELVTPMFPTMAMATTSAGGSLAYLTIRPAKPAEDGGRRYEVGVVGHGPKAISLAEQVGQEITTWNTDFRTRSVRFEIPDTPRTEAPGTGRFVLDRPNHPITIIWE
ncbi:methyltransferase, FxLD system [Streptomyces jumonjinensis]|uniref:Protein-L-isoaspartate O-methyltransferase n=1 Tax=Streptomyces jumonjinensis TaxID=1945 RepID=A0A646KRX5_STRJU|nr:methyltransferase, FxLD system [Streptomyces jumonjinensis]MQT05084.1 methyltransferase, FxLD system [Streptomyces jumonjinensis]